MSIYFNMNGIQNKSNIKDCVCSLDGNSVKRVKSIWGGGKRLKPREAVGTQ